MALSEAAMAAIASGVVAAASTAGAAGSAALANRRQYKNWLKQHSIERAEFLADREYNSPAMQMERYRSAGLNPNLIYGQDNSQSVMSRGGAIQSDSSASYISEGIGRLQQVFDLYNNFKNSEKQRQLADSNITANEAKERYYNSMSNRQNTLNDLDFLKYNAFSRNHYFDEFAINLVRRNLGLDLNNRFLDATLTNRIKQTDSLLRWYNLRNEYQQIENYWNAPKLKIPETDLFNMYKNITATQGWQKSNLMQSQIDLNNASALNKFAQSGLYAERGAFTNIKSWLAPMEFLLNVARTIFGK